MATKSFQPISATDKRGDEKKSMDNPVPRSTAHKTKWWCKVLEEWKKNQLVKCCTLHGVSH